MAARSHQRTAAATSPGHPWICSKSAWRDDKETIDEETLGGVGVGQLGAGQGCEYLEKKVVVVVVVRASAGGGTHVLVGEEGGGGGGTHVLGVGSDLA